MKIGIVGSRNYSKLNLVRNFVENLPKDTIIVSGGANGVDFTAVRTAVINNFEWKEFLPDKKKYGLPRAFFVRNKEIVDFSDFIVAFWNGESGGTYHTIEYAKKQNKLFVIVYEF